MGGADLEELQEAGWNWSVGFTPNYGGYYAQAWKPLLKQLRINGAWVFRECLTEGGASIESAMKALRKRIRSR